MKKRTLLYFIIFAIVLFANILIVWVQKSKAAISPYSVPALLVMLMSMIHAISCYFMRHKGNYLPYGSGSPFPFSSDKDYTFEEPYLDRFFLMLEIYCLSIPFYIPQIFLTTNNMQQLWTVVTCLSPEIVFIIMGITDTLKKVKEDKIRKAQIEKERTEQERREELGKF